MQWLGFLLLLIFWLEHGCFIASCAYALILRSNFYSAILGFGILGLGLSVIIPELFRWAGQTKGVKASAAISIVSGIGFTGFLIGSVLLGFISNCTNLLTSYVFLFVLILSAFCITILRLKKSCKS